VPEVQLRAAAVVPVAPAARPAWVRWSPAGPAWALWVLALLGLLATAWLDRLLRLAGRPELASLPAAIPLSGFVLLLTPTGSLPSPRWRRWAQVAAAAPLAAVVTSALLPFEPPYRSVPNPLAVPALAGPLGPVNGVAWAATGLTVLVAAASLVVRFRRARGTERQQLRWVALAAALTRGGPAGPGRPDPGRKPAAAGLAGRPSA
jgi:hypothetical protein